MPISFSGLKRNDQIRMMQEQEFDLLVIGGGITGAGIALDAQCRGIQTALLEMQDFAAGTSSRSTKLVHGGLRYLKQFEVKMVAEVGKERAIVYENGPHVTTPRKMMLPLYEGGTFGKFSSSVGLRVYDYLAGVKKSERRKMLSVYETLEKEPLLKREGLNGSGYYVEYLTDDARLTIEVLKKAAEFGARIVNYAKVEHLLYRDEMLNGVMVKNQISGEQYEIRARKIVNAAGPWVDDLREKDRSKQGKTLSLTKGVHLVFDSRRLPLRQSIYFDTPDGRMVFAIPRDGKTYIGTTDTHYHGNVIDPRMTTEDRDYLLSVANNIFPGLKLTGLDVESSWTGLRPLIHQEGKDPSEISRRDEVFVSSSGLITIAGGKLTGYRKMAETVVDLVAGKLVAEGKAPVRECRTKTMPISGGEVGGSASLAYFNERKIREGESYGLRNDEAKLLVHRYGSNIDKVYALIEKHRSEAEHYRIPVYLMGSLIYGIDQEMVVKPEDYFIRRTGALFFDIGWVQAWKEPVIAFMTDRFGWTPEVRRAYTEELDQQICNAIVPVETMPS